MSRRYHADLALIEPRHMKMLKEIMFREFARQNMTGPDTDPDVEFTDFKLSAKAIAPERKKR